MQLRATAIVVKLIVFSHTHTLSHTHPHPHPLGQLRGSMMSHTRIGHTSLNTYAFRILFFNVCPLYMDFLRSNSSAKTFKTMFN